jgi:hypothetical protein
MHELATYHRSNPDPERAGLCNNTGEVIDGVVFPGITPMEGSICFVGRTSLHEAIAELHSTTVAEVQDRLAADGSKNLQEIKRLKSEIKRLNTEVSKFASFADALERAGFIAPALS